MPLETYAKYIKFLESLHFGFSLLIHSETIKLELIFKNWSHLSERFYYIGRKWDTLLAFQDKYNMDFMYFGKKYFVNSK